MYTPQFTALSDGIKVMDKQENSFPENLRHHNLALICKEVE
jgi:hypothetical protein